jgi:multiple sugar transport system substrate-binding protein
MARNLNRSRRDFLKVAGMAAAGLAATSLLQACQPQAAAPAPGQSGKPAGPAKVTGKFQFIMKQDWNKVHNEYIRNELLNYGKEKGWDMDVSYTEGFAAGGSIIVKLTASVQAGDPPDGMFQDQVSLYQLQFLDLVVPIDDLVTEAMKTWGEPAPRIKKESFIDGKWYGMPWIVLSGAMWTRKDYFEAAGIKDLDKSLDTWDHARDACMQVSDPTKQIWGWGNTINRSSDGHNMVLLPIQGWGGSLCDETGQFITLNSPETIEAVKWLYETHSSPKFEKMRPPGLGSWTDPSNNEAFLANKIAYTYNGGTLYAQGLQEKWPNAKNVVAMKYPGGPKRRLHALNGPTFFTFKGSKNFDAFREITQYMVSVDKIKFLCENSPGWCLPAFTKMWSDEIEKLNPNNPLFKDISLGSDYNGTPYPGPNTPAAAACTAANVFTDMMGSVMGGQKPEDAVKSAHDRAIQIYKEFGMKAVKS